MWGAPPTGNTPWRCDEAEEEEEEEEEGGQSWEAGAGAEALRVT